MVFLSPLEQFDPVLFFIYCIFEDMDISFLTFLFPLILLCGLFCSVFFYVRRDFKVIPESWQFIFESIYLLVLNIVKQQLGEKGFIYLPFIFIVFIFVFFCNLISLFPFGIALTSHLVIIEFLSLSFCIAIFIIGLVMNNMKFLRIFIPHCPFYLLFLLIPIEIFSYLIRMFSLAIRLAANIFAGHTLVYIISSFILFITNIGFMYVCFIFFPLFAILALELVVAFLQAYVFAVLLCIYLNDSFNFSEH